MCKTKMPQKWWLELPNDSISCFSVLKLRQKKSFMSKKVDAWNLGLKVRKKEQINYALKKWFNTTGCKCFTKNVVLGPL